MDSKCTLHLSDLQVGKELAVMGIREAGDNESCPYAKLKINTMVYCISNISDDEQIISIGRGTLVFEVVDVQNPLTRQLNYYYSK